MTRIIRSLSSLKTSESLRDILRSKAKPSDKMAEAHLKKLMSDTRTEYSECLRHFKFGGGDGGSGDGNGSLESTCGSLMEPYGSKYEPVNKAAFNEIMKSAPIDKTAASKSRSWFTDAQWDKAKKIGALSFWPGGTSIYLYTTDADFRANMNKTASTVYNSIAKIPEHVQNGYNDFSDGCVRFSNYVEDACERLSAYFGE